MIRILTIAVGRLSGILRAHVLYGFSPIGEERRSITQALTEVMDELDLKL